jgi:hypothetical protein
VTEEARTCSQQSPAVVRPRIGSRPRTGARTTVSAESERPRPTYPGGHALACRCHRLPRRSTEGRSRRRGHAHQEHALLFEIELSIPNPTDERRPFG